MFGTRLVLLLAYKLLSIIYFTWLHDFPCFCTNQTVTGPGTIGPFIRPIGLGIDPASVFEFMLSWPCCQQNRSTWLIDRSIWPCFTLFHSVLTLFSEIVWVWLCGPIGICSGPIGLLAFSAGLIFTCCVTAGWIDRFCTIERSACLVCSVSGPFEPVD
jgi:hypothetical protein